MPENLLDMKGIAKFLSVSVKQIENFIKDDKIPFVMVGKRKRFSPTDVLLSFKDHE